MSAQEAKSSQVCHLTAICRSSTHRTSTHRSSAHQTENPSFLPSCVKVKSSLLSKHKQHTTKRQQWWKGVGGDDGGVPSRLDLTCLDFMRLKCRNDAPQLSPVHYAARRLLRRGWPDLYGGHQQ